MYHFVVEATNAPYPSIASSDERILQLSQFMNRCMEKEKQTRRRQVHAGLRACCCCCCPGACNTATHALVVRGVRREQARQAVPQRYAA